MIDGYYDIVTSWQQSLAAQIRPPTSEAGQSDTTSLPPPNIRPVYTSADAYVSHSPSLRIYVRFGELPVHKYEPWSWGGLYFSENETRMRKWGLSNAWIIGFELNPSATISFEYLADKISQPVELIREVLANYYNHGQGILTSAWSINDSTSNCLSFKASSERR